jgi:cytochrome c
VTRAALGAGLAAAALAIASACGESRVERDARALTGGDPRRGRSLVQTYGCGSCHRVPGVPGANGTVGPPLDGIASRSFVAGRLSNSPEALMRWVKHPRQVDPHTAMPEMGVSDRDARDLAAYLETLR